MNDSRWREGLYDEGAHLWLLEPAHRFEHLADEQFLRVGRPGVDGIGFGYRENQPGFWAFYPQEGTFKLLAASVGEFIEGWYAGKITV
ncbi:MAG TPA: hypothetical protein VMS12_12595 [Thermoanaerobaculia bacterium]|nr:hypothetical protein [Thermoanaerobaculia bacterium]